MLPLALARENVKSSPWSSIPELMTVYTNIFNYNAPSRQWQALRSIQVWRQRTSKLPMSIESTAAFIHLHLNQLPRRFRYSSDLKRHISTLETQSFDGQILSDCILTENLIESLETVELEPPYDQCMAQPTFPRQNNISDMAEDPSTTWDLSNTESRDDAVNSHYLRYTYAVLIVRFVNGLVDSLQQGGTVAQSVLRLSMQLNIPRICVDIRHGATHNDLPDLTVLRCGAGHAMRWLHTHYWMPLFEPYITHYSSIQGLYSSYKVAMAQYNKYLKTSKTTSHRLGDPLGILRQCNLLYSYTYDSQSTPAIQRSRFYQQHHPQMQHLLALHHRVMSPMSFFNVYLPSPYEQGIPSNLENLSQLKPNLFTRHIGFITDYASNVYRLLARIRKSQHDELSQSKSFGKSTSFQHHYLFGLPTSSISTQGDPTQDSNLASMSPVLGPDSSTINNKSQNHQSVLAYYLQTIINAALPNANISPLTTKVSAGSNSMLSPSDSRYPDGVLSSGVATSWMQPCDDYDKFNLAIVHTCAQYLANIYAYQHSSLPNIVSMTNGDSGATICNDSVHVEQVSTILHRHRTLNYTSKRTPADIIEIDSSSSDEAPSQSDNSPEERSRSLPKTNSPLSPADMAASPTMSVHRPDIPEIPEIPAVLSENLTHSELHEGDQVNQHIDVIDLSADDMCHTNSSIAQSPLSSSQVDNEGMNDDTTPSMTCVQSTHTVDDSIGSSHSQPAIALRKPIPVNQQYEQQDGHTQLLQYIQDSAESILNNLRTQCFDPYYINMHPHPKPSPHMTRKPNVHCQDINLTTMDQQQFVDYFPQYNPSLHYMHIYHNIEYLQQMPAPTQHKPSLPAMSAPSSSLVPMGNLGHREDETVSPSLSSSHLSPNMLDYLMAYYSSTSQQLTQWYDRLLPLAHHLATKKAENPTKRPVTSKLGRKGPFTAKSKLGKSNTLTHTNINVNMSDHSIHCFNIAQDHLEPYSSRLLASNTTPSDSRPHSERNKDKSKASFMKHFYQIFRLSTSPTLPSFYHRHQSLVDTVSSNPNPLDISQLSGGKASVSPWDHKDIVYIHKSDSNAAYKYNYTDIIVNPKYRCVLSLGASDQDAITNTDMCDAVDSTKASYSERQTKKEKTAFTPTSIVSSIYDYYDTLDVCSNSLLLGTSQDLVDFLLADLPHDVKERTMAKIPFDSLVQSSSCADDTHTTETRTTKEPFDDENITSIDMESDDNRENDCSHDDVEVDEANSASGADDDLAADRETYCTTKTHIKASVADASPTSNQSPHRLVSPALLKRTSSVLGSHQAQDSVIALDYTSSDIIESDPAEQLVVLPEGTPLRTEHADDKSLSSQDPMAGDHDNDYLSCSSHRYNPRKKTSPESSPHCSSNTSLRQEAVSLSSPTPLSIQSHTDNPNSIMATHTPLPELLPPTDNNTPMPPCQHPSQSHPSPQLQSNGPPNTNPFAVNPFSSPFGTGTSSFKPPSMLGGNATSHTEQQSIPPTGDHPPRESVTSAANSQAGAPSNPFAAPFSTTPFTSPFSSPFSSPFTPHGTTSFAPPPSSFSTGAPMFGQTPAYPLFSSNLPSAVANTAPNEQAVQPSDRTTHHTNPFSKDIKKAVPDPNTTLEIDPQPVITPEKYSLDDVPTYVSNYCTKYSIMEDEQWSNAYALYLYHTQLLAFLLQLNLYYCQEHHIMLSHYCGNYPIGLPVDTGDEAVCLLPSLSPSENGQITQQSSLKTHVNSIMHFKATHYSKNMIHFSKNRFGAIPQYYELLSDATLTPFTTKSTNTDEEGDGITEDVLFAIQSLIEALTDDHQWNNSIVASIQHHLTFAQFNANLKLTPATIIPTPMLSQLITAVVPHLLLAQGNLITWPKVTKTMPPTSGNVSKVTTQLLGQYGLLLKLLCCYYPQFQTMFVQILFETLFRYDLLIASLYHPQLLSLYYSNANDLGSSLKPKSTDDHSMTDSIVPPIHDSPSPQSESSPTTPQADHSDTSQDGSHPKTTDVNHLLVGDLDALQDLVELLDFNITQSLTTLTQHEPLYQFHPISSNIRVTQELLTSRNAFVSSYSQHISPSTGSLHMSHLPLQVQWVYHLIVEYITIFSIPITSESLYNLVDSHYPLRDAQWQGQDCDPSSHTPGPALQFSRSFPVLSNISESYTHSMNIQPFFIPSTHDVAPTHLCERLEVYSLNWPLILRVLHEQYQLVTTHLGSTLSPSTPRSLQGIPTHSAQQPCPVHFVGLALVQQVIPAIDVVFSLMDALSISSSADSTSDIHHTTLGNTLRYSSGWAPSSMHGNFMPSGAILALPLQ